MENQEIKNVRREKIDFKHFMALYSNVSLLNALNYVRDQQIKGKKLTILEKSIEEHFCFNKSWENIINQGKRKFKKHEKKEFSWKPLDDYKSFEKKFIMYLRIIRNFYSHIIPEKIKNDEKWLDTNEEKILSVIKNIFKYHFLGAFFQDLSKEELRIYLVSLFLTQKEFKDFLSDLKNIKKDTQSIKTSFITTLEYEKKVRINFPIKISEINTSITFEVFNYLKDWNDIKDHRSYKRRFLKIATSLLNYFFYGKNKDNPLRFEILKDKEMMKNQKSVSPKGHLLVKIFFEKNPNNFLLTNFKTIRHILMLIKSDKNLLAYEWIKNKLENTSNHQDDIDYSKTQNKSEKFKWLDNEKDFLLYHKRFCSNFSNNSNIPLRQLLKILNKTMAFRGELIIDTNDNAEKSKIKYMNHDEFEKLFISIHTKNFERLLKDKKEFAKILEKNLNVNFETDNAEEIIKQIKNYIYKYFKDENNFKKFFEFKKQNWLENQKISNVNSLNNKPNYPLFKLEKKELENNETQDIRRQENRETVVGFHINKSFSYGRFFDKEEICNNSQRYIKKFIAPIVNFYDKLNICKNKDSKNFVGSKGIERMLESKNNLVISKEKFTKIFENKIYLEKQSTRTQNSLLINEFDKNNKKIKINILNKYVVSEQEMLRSKIFKEFLKLIYKKQIYDNKFVIDSEKFKKLLGEIKKYKQQEYDFIKKALQIEKLPENSNFKRYRNAILHRSFSNFNNKDELYGVLKLKISFN